MNKQIVPCTSRWGHKFRPRYGPLTKDLAQWHRDAYSEENYSFQTNMAVMLRPYLGDICERCGQIRTFFVT